MAPAAIERSQQAQFLSRQYDTVAAKTSRTLAPLDESVQYKEVNVGQDQSG
jgi:hypothetical protein